MSTNPSDSHQDLSTMPPPTKPLTLILAATPSLGIGKSNDLPWPKLKKELAYFARVTKRVSSPAKINAVLMGRKTWDSIPPKFRPLKGRLNVVVTRDVEKLEAEITTEKRDAQDESPLIASGILDALRRLSTPGQNPEVENVFVIGGASVYASALELPQTKRVLLTKIEKEFECDTFFPVNLEEAAVWRRCGRAELEDFTGETVAEREEEGGVGFEFCLFEKVES